MGAGWTGAVLLEAILQLWPELEHAADPQKVVEALNTLGFPVSQETAVFDVLKEPVTESFEAGWEFGQEQLGHAGSFDPTDSLASGALAQALGQLKIELKGVSETSVGLIGDSLAQSVTEGVGSRVAGERITEVLHDAKRAHVIARTEIARAMEGAMLAQAKSMSGVDKAWSDAPTACPICQANTAEGAIPLDKDFASGDPNPPAHPRCRCALTLVPSPIPAFA